MANALYSKYKEACLTGSPAISLTLDTIKCVLVDTGSYTVNLATDQYLSDIAGGARTATSSALSSKSATLGVFDAADITFTAVSGAVSEALVLYKDTGSAATSPLIAYIDTATGLPVTPAGTDIAVAWSNGSSKIFAL